MLPRKHRELGVAVVHPYDPSSGCEAPKMVVHGFGAHACAFDCTYGLSGRGSEDN
jgi:hypothetical protein